ncbi:hypothetical protein SUGI_0849900 [Cryptomeria japonica]|uniref:laccase-2 n=1 Tax=Cryptomeria japonica TaxID=3369 RepID=UPI002414958D|nr:laccase-2 [Cryptomeria japonica]GLJ41052.1 hypothetical protein SUGI_0849900 [Cryptomeria japonica]
MNFQRTFFLFFLLVIAEIVAAKHVTKYFEFNVQYQNVTRLCHTKSMLTINGQYPGPTIAVNEGDHVVIKVTNHVEYNMTIHWHGIRQMRTGWADGPAYITQCPIQKGHSYTYKFKVFQQVGSLFWHAHISWQRATIHGAFNIYPKKEYPYPFPKPDAEAQILFGEWWNDDVETIVAEATKYGGGPNVSDAYTINGQPGLLFPCSSKDVFVQHVDHGKRYLFRIVNAALNDELFFAIANHSFTVVEIDATYTKPYKTEFILIAPGQTMSVLVMADQPKGRYVMAARPYVTSDVPFDNTTTTAILEYTDLKSSESHESSHPIFMPKLPKMRDFLLATEFSTSLRSLNSREFPSWVPLKIDTHLLFTIALNLQDCPKGKICKGYFGGRFSASVNNQSFVHPHIALLQAAYHNISGVFSPDFPNRPPHQFNYTDLKLNLNMNPHFSTRVSVIPYNANVQLILQDTSMMGTENHPIHIHGFNFFVVGQGFGNYDPLKDPSCFNLVDPPMRNTIGVPSGGWAVLRFKADNPGVWFMHCHLEVHTSWGLAMAFMVENGPTALESIRRPPSDLPPC